MSHFYSHFQKTYLAEGIVREQKCLIIDPEVLRTKQHWLKFLPAVAEIKQSQAPEESKDETLLKAAWRYQDLTEEQKLQKPTTLQQIKTTEYKYDSSKPMGNSVANLASHQLNKDANLLHLPHQPESTLTELWESICNEI